MASSDRRRGQESQILRARKSMKSQRLAGFSLSESPFNIKGMLASPLPTTRARSTREEQPPLKLCCRRGKMTKLKRVPFSTPSRGNAESIYWSVNVKAMTILQIVRE